VHQSSERFYRTWLDQYEIMRHLVLIIEHEFDGLASLCMKNFFIIGHFLIDRAQYKGKIRLDLRDLTNPHIDQLITRSIHTMNRNSILTFFEKTGLIFIEFDIPVLGVVAGF